MKKQTILLACFTAGALLLTGCSNNAQTGALVGSLVGAGIGKSTSNHRDKRAVIGGVLGGIVGSAIGSEQDRRNAAYRRTANSTYTTPYYEGGTASKTVTQHPTVSHKHGNRTHSHPGGSGTHQHNYNNQQTVQSGSAPQQVVRETVYVERPAAYYYPPVTTSIVLGAGYYGGYRGYKRRYNRHHRRHHRNHHRHRSHTRRH